MTHFTLLATLIFFGDASLAYFVPNYIEQTFHSSIIMGLVISSSSIVGLTTDIAFPQIFPSLSVKKSLLLTILFQLIFVGTLIATLFHPRLWLFLLAMASWGIYFEFLSFSSKIFVTKKVPHNLNSVAWASIMFGQSLSYILGPVVITLLILKGNFAVLMTILAIVLTAQIITLLFPIKNTAVEEKEEKIVKTPLLSQEFGYWKVLIKVAWPALVVTFLFALIDSSFWTIGAILAQKLESAFFYAFLFIPLYVLPMLFSQLILMKAKVTAGKEKYAALFLLLGTITLAMTGFSTGGVILLIIALTTGFFNSLAFPLAEASHTDLEDRMGIHRQHLIGLSSSVFSLGYIIGPLLAGFLSNAYHERFSFSIIGAIAAAASLLVLLLAPKRSVLPQKEIKEWDG